MNYLCLASVWILYFMTHSIWASNQVKNQIEKLAPSFFPFYRIVYNISALGLLLLVLYYQGSFSSNVLFQTSIVTQISGYGTSVIGVLIALVAFKNYSGQEFLGLDFKKKEKQRNPSLTTSGLNKYVRHPLYFAALLIVWGYFLAKPDFTILTMSSVISVYLIIGTKLEEQKLIKEFGAQYKRYIKEVPMLLPFGFLK